MPLCECHSRPNSTFSTAVWAVRPDGELYTRLLAFLGRGRFGCITGDQTAANAFFRSQPAGAAAVNMCALMSHDEP